MIQSRMIGFFPLNIFLSPRFCRFKADKHKKHKSKKEQSDKPDPDATAHGEFFLLFLYDGYIYSLLLVCLNAIPLTKPQNQKY